VALLRSGSPVPTAGIEWRPVQIFRANAQDLRVVGVIASRCHQVIGSRGRQSLSLSLPACSASQLATGLAIARYGLAAPGF
jgi:hypothetical protein